MYAGVINRSYVVVVVFSVSFGTDCERQAELVITGEKLSRFRALTLLELLVSVTTSRLSLEVYYSMVK